jgi:hypothetical protein
MRVTSTPSSDTQISVLILEAKDTFFRSFIGGPGAFHQTFYQLTTIGTALRGTWLDRQGENKELGIDLHRVSGNWL